MHIPSAFLRFGLFAISSCYMARPSSWEKTARASLLCLRESLLLQDLTRRGEARTSPSRRAHRNPSLADAYAWRGLNGDLVQDTFCVPRASSTSQRTSRN